MASSIVCAVDGSPLARSAAQRGSDLATRLSLETVAVHAFVPSAPPALRAPAPPRDAIANEEQVRRERLDSWLEDARVGDIRRRVEVGSIPGVISAVAEEENAALIALGTHGAGGLRAMLRLSISGTLLRIARHPLLLVPPAVMSAGAPAGPVVAAVGSPADASWVGVAATLASAYRVPLLLAHAAPNHDGSPGMAPPFPLDLFSAILGVLGERAASVLTRVCPGPPGDALPVLARSVDARMIVSGTRGHGPLRARLSDSTARLLLTGASAPVVVCPPRMAHRTRIIEAA